MVHIGGKNLEVKNDKPIVKDVQVVIQEKVKEVAAQIDAQCKVAPEAIDILNLAADNVKPGAEK